MQRTLRALGWIMLLMMPCTGCQSLLESLLGSAMSRQQYGESGHPSSVHERQARLEEERIRQFDRSESLRQWREQHAFPDVRFDP